MSKPGAAITFLQNSVTPVSVTPPERKISPGEGTVFMGSCFAEYLHRYYRRLLLPGYWSPFGNIYNPLSLAQCLELLIEDPDRIVSSIIEKNLFEHNGVWRHFAFHTKDCVSQREDYLKIVANHLSQGHVQLKEAGTLVLTLGTAYVYRLRETGEVVNNCHTLPQKLFSRELVSISQGAEKLEKALGALVKLNPGIKIVYTLSPVRHLRDKPEENSLSKARLRCMIEEVQGRVPGWYFPAYEIVLDELRDYRWYAGDLCHPGPEAVEYVISRFVEAGFDDPGREFVDKIQPVLKGLAHKPLRPEGEEYRKFVAALERKYRELEKQFVFLPQWDDIRNMGARNGIG